MNTTHTPGPWEVRPTTRAGNGTRWRDIVSMGGEYAGSYVAEALDRDAQLIIAAPDLLTCQTMGTEINTPDFLDWIADRLVNVHGENPNTDYVLSLRDRANAGRSAIAKATGEEI